MKGLIIRGASVWPKKMFEAATSDSQAVVPTVTCEKKFQKSWIFNLFWYIPWTDLYMPFCKFEDSLKQWRTHTFLEGVLVTKIMILETFLYLQI